MSQWRSNKDANRNQIFNLVAQVLASAPATPIQGLFYYDSTLLTLRFYNGTAWVNVDATLRTGIPFANLSSPTAAFSFNGQLINGVATPVVGTDAANKSYVDGQLQSVQSGISAKGSVVTVATTNVATLSGIATVIDGITMSVAGERTLLTAQTTASQNGPWVIQAGAWTRPVTDGALAELEVGALWAVEQGTANQISQWILNSPVFGTAITPGTTSIGIVKFAAGGTTYTAGTNGGLVVAGSAFSVLLPGASGLIEDATGLHVDTAIVTRKYSATIGDGTTTALVVTHNLNTLDVIAQVYDSAVAGANYIECDIQRTTVNTVTLGFSVAPTANSIRVTVLA